jgi:hypothetical protein
MIPPGTPLSSWQAAPDREQRSGYGHVSLTLPPTSLVKSLPGTRNRIATPDHHPTIPYATIHSMNSRDIRGKTAKFANSGKTAKFANK